MLNSFIYFIWLCLVLICLFFTIDYVVTKIKQNKNTAKKELNKVKNAKVNK